MYIKKDFFVFHLLLLNFIYGMFFFSNDPVYKARKYLKLSLSNYRQAIKKNPSDIRLIEEYRKILEAAIGKTASDVEMAILYQEIGKEYESDKILLKVGITEKLEAIKYIEEKINISRSLKEKVNLYKIALKLSPRNGNYWYKLGRLYLGLNKINEGISALEKAYDFNVENIELFYYLAEAYIYKNNFKKAKLYIQEGLKKEENISLHKLLYSIYRRENKRHLAKNERGKNKEKWKRYKERINRNKKYIKIELSDIQILPYGKTSFGYVYVAFFKQDYNSSNFSSKIYKTLYFVKRKDEWKILS